MSTIYINGMEYQSENLSDDAKAHLSSIQFVDSELVRLQAQIAALQTARIAYANALSEVLKKTPTDTAKLS